LSSLQSDGRAPDDGVTRWQVVTVYRPGDEVMPDGNPPEPLAKLGDRIDVRAQPAPGDRGTELAARLRTPPSPDATGPIARISGEDPRQEVRAALRNVKMLIETGEILQPDRPPTTKRTLTGLPLELVTRRARGEGRLCRPEHPERAAPHPQGETQLGLRGRTCIS
jgi:hypothetical protein